MKLAAITLAALVAITLYTWPPFVYPTQHGVTVGMGFHGYHWAFK